MRLKRANRLHFGFVALVPLWLGICSIISGCATSNAYSLRHDPNQLEAVGGGACVGAAVLGLGWRPPRRRQRAPDRAIRTVVRRRRNRCQLCRSPSLPGHETWRGYELSDCGSSGTRPLGGCHQSFGQEDQSVLDPDANNGS